MSVSVEVLKIQENTLFFYPQLRGGDVGRFAIRDCSNNRLIEISDDEQLMIETVVFVNQRIKR